MKKTIVTIKRENYRGSKVKITIECEGVMIELWPDKLQIYDITDLLHGGKNEIQLPCEINKEDD